MVKERYTDTWSMQIPENKLAAYNALIREGLIKDPEVTYNRTNKTTIVEYSADHPHEWIRQELKKRTERTA